ncbi:hypothetical protein Trco_001798 [Trichoderma cornu-damae]|uniref:Uncharacterized protein n=1 Tax=Trichoderma cornu-damae TaxID=654480 RepID=A0A9P8TXU9_9HYPO|nr:hypothetical protein Trco_001798 [Trichoderma cornu-damae]
MLIEPCSVHEQFASSPSVGMVLGGLRRSRSLESLRRDLFHNITNTTEGIHFLSGSTILEDKDADKKLLAVLCPQEEFKATDKGMAHMSKLLIQCNKWLPVLEERDSDMYWAVVASSTSQIQGIELPPKMARALAFSLLRARQRWILRQTDPASSQKAIKSHLIAGLQRLLELFERRDENPAVALTLTREDREWKLTEKETREACKARPMGPGRRMSRGRIALSFNSPHRLYPIGQIPGAPQLEANRLGMIDSSVEKITPTEAVQALISRRLMDVRRSQRMAAEEAARKRASQAASSQARLPREDDARSGSGGKPANGLMRRVLPSSLTTKFKSSWMRGPAFRKDSGESSAEPSKRPQATGAASSSATASSATASSATASSTKRRFLSEETGNPAKKQVVAKGTARSVSSPAVGQRLVAPANISRSPSVRAGGSLKK